MVVLDHTVQLYQISGGNVFRHTKLTLGRVVYTILFSNVLTLAIIYLFFI